VVVIEYNHQMVRYLEVEVVDILHNEVILHEMQLEMVVLVLLRQ
jgi:hypothetical protein